jgi:hypothetical protein
MGLAKKDDFRGITVKNADQKQFFSNFLVLTPYPKGRSSPICEKIGPLWLQKLLFCGNLAIFAKN